MKSFFIAMGFFTRLPVPKVEYTEKRFAGAIRLAPLAGLVIGALLVLAALVCVFLKVPDLIRAAILLFFYIVITGGLHFDGLADTCDGYFSGRSREQSLEIMKDSRIGTFGVLALFMAGLFYFVLFVYAPLPALLLFPLIGRANFLISAKWAPYVREQGMGKAVGNAVDEWWGFILPWFMAIGVSFLALPFARLVSNFVVLDYLPVLYPVASLLAAAISVVVTGGITLSFKEKFGGATGDTYGAVIEVSSIIYILAFTVLCPLLTP